MKITLKDANNILRNYNLGTSKSMKRLTKGYANINYKVETNKGNFLLRLCKEKTRKEILYEITVMNKLKKIRFPAAFPIQRDDGDVINYTEFGNVVIYEYAEGKEPDINNETAKEIGRAVAKLNSLKDWKDIKKGNAINLELYNKVIEKSYSAKNKYPELLKYFKEETEFLSEPLAKKVPQGLVHGDIFPDNTKFKGKKLIAILDFEEVCTDNLLFDIGVTINGFCFKNNKLNPELLSSFMKGYEKTRKISGNERKLLPYYIQWGAHAMICWHLDHLLSNKDAKKLSRANYLMKRVKELRELDNSFFNAP